MSKYKDLENIGQVFAQELFDDIADENIKYNEIFYKKVVNKLAEAYNFGLTESMSELQEAMDAIKSLEAK